MKKCIAISISSIFLIMCNQNTMEHGQWEQDKLEIPKMIRQPNENDIPKNDSLYQNWLERKSISLTEGFSFSLKASEDSINYKFYSEINIDNNNLFNLFNSLIETIHGEAYIVHKSNSENDVEYSELKHPIIEIKNKISSYEYDIINNCSFDFGIVYNEEELIEVYIDESKFIKYWGSNEELFKSVMSNYGLKENNNMKFVDQFPKIVYELSFIETDKRTTEELIEKLKNEF